MTDLPTLLHERADRATLAPVDLTAVTREGSRRVRRRRLAVSATALAAVAGLGATAALGGGDAARVVDPAAPAPSSGASWYLDGRLHHDGTSTDLGLDVATYVRTRAGFVLVDTDDVVWSWTGGRPERVGVAADAPQRLAGDAEGDRVAWIDPTGQDGPSVRVLDLGSGELAGAFRVGDASEAARGGDAGDEAGGDTMVTAVEGDRVWWVEGRRSLTWTGPAGGVPTRLPDDTRVLAASGERIVYEADDQIRTTTTGTPAADDTVLDESYRDVGALSTDGRLWSADADTLVVRRTADGSPLDVALDTPFSTGYAWADADSLLVLAGAGTATEGVDLRAQVLVCEVPAMTCETMAEDLGTFAELEAGDFALPLGIEIG
jgi:hypothetical protein